MTHYPYTQHGLAIQETQISHMDRPSAGPLVAVPFSKLSSGNMENGKTATDCKVMLDLCHRHDSVMTITNEHKWLGDLTKYEAESDTLVLEPKKKLKRPSFYKVVLLNDDYTPMDFVVEILMQIYRKTHEEAVEIMYQVHNKGVAIVGRYTRDVAETKIDQTIHQARKHDYPLQCTMEQE